MSGMGAEADVLMTVADCGTMQIAGRNRLAEAAGAGPDDLEDTAAPICTRESMQ